MKLDHRKYTVIAVLAALILLLMAGSVMAEPGISPVITAFQPDKTTPVETGEKVTWTVEAGGGVGDLQYAFYIYKKADGTDLRVHMQWYSASNQVEYTPLEHGTYYARAFVIDEAEASVWRDTLPIHDVVVTGGIPVLSKVVFTDYPGAVEPAIYEAGDELTYKVQAYGGDEPITGGVDYAFYVFKDGARVHLVWYGEVEPDQNGVAELKYTPKEPGVYQVQAFARDATKALSNKSETIVVGGSSQELGIEIGQGEESNGTITWNIVASGGKEPYEYAFYVYYRGDEGEAWTRVFMDWYKLRVDPVEFTYAPEKVGNYELQAFVKDADGKTAYDRGGNAELEETTAALSVAFTGVPSEEDELGSVMTWTAEAAGGTPPYQYAFYVYEGETRVFMQWYGEASSVSYTPKNAGVNYYVHVFAKDSLGALATADSVMVAFEGEDIKPFGIESVEFAKNCTANVQHLHKTAKKGEPQYEYHDITYDGYSLTEFEAPWVWEVTLPDNHDGVEPFSYSYYVYKGSTRVEMQWYEEDKTTCQYTPKEVGEYWVRAFVQDKNGRVVRMDSEPQETKLYHFYYTFKAPDLDRVDQFQGENASKDPFGYVMSSGYLPMAEYVTMANGSAVTSDPLTHRSYNNHTKNIVMDVKFGEENTVHSVAPLSGDYPYNRMDNGFKIACNAKVGNVVKDKWYTVNSFKKESDGTVSFSLKDDDDSIVQLTQSDTVRKLYWSTNGESRVGYNAPGTGVLTLNTKTENIDGNGAMVWECAKDESVYRFAGLRPTLANKDSSVRREFWRYMITPNLPYGEVKFKNIHSSYENAPDGVKPTGLDQDARFNFDFLLNTSLGLNEYDERVGISISETGRIGILDTKAGQGYRDLGRNFYTAEHEKNAKDFYGFNNEGWNTLRLQARADGKVDMILNGHLVYTTPIGYYHITNAERGTIMLEVVQAAESHPFTGWNSNQVGNASVELKEYSFGIQRLLQIAPDPGTFSYVGQ